MQAVAGRYYGVQAATTLPGTWQLQAVTIAAPNATQTRFLVDKPETHAFYRVLALP